MHHTEYLLLLLPWAWGFARIAYAAAESVPGSPSQRIPKGHGARFQVFRACFHFLVYLFWLSVGAERHAHGPTRRPINAVTGITVKFATLPFFMQPSLARGGRTNNSAKDEG
jgi:hypothetical protein